MNEPTNHRTVSISWKRLALAQGTFIGLLCTGLLWFITNDRARAFENIDSNTKRIDTIERNLILLPTKAEIKEMLDDKFDAMLRQRNIIGPHR